MFLQAVSDDSISQNGEQRLYMAGYLNYADDWARFADAWADELAAAPSISHLKMVEAQNLRGPFRGWTEQQKDEKLASLARVIRHFRPISFDVSISVKDFNAIVKPHAPYGLATPYFPCLFAVVASVARFMQQSGSKLPIDFIFDEQHGVGDDFQHYFQFMARNLPNGARKLVNGSPIFKEDKTYLPLQAADMLAWHTRREYDDGLAQFGMPMAERIRGEHHLSSALPREMLEKWAEAFSQQKGLNQVQSKSQWRKFRTASRAALAAGYVPPHGTRWKNLVHRAHEIFARLINR